MHAYGERFGNPTMTGLRRIARSVVAVIAPVTLVVSLCVMLQMAIGGPVLWRAGDLTILRSSHFRDPLVFGLLAAAAMLRLFRPCWFERIVRLLNPIGWGLSILLAMTLFHGLSGRHTIHGDGKEYILQAQSIAFDGTLLINTGTRRDYWNQTNPYGIELGDTRQAAESLSEASQAGGGFGGLYPDRFGDYRYYHYWAYSAVVAPVYLLLHLLDGSGNLEYLSFRVVNVCLLLAFFLLAFRESPHWPALAILFLLLFSPLIPYCDWQHPELFCLTLVFAAFFLATHPKGSLASAPLLGLAASMNPPILLFLPSLALVTIRPLDLRQPRPLWKLAASYMIGTVIGLSSSMYFFYYFGTPNVIAQIGLASLRYASVSRALDIFFSPLVGAFFFFPALLLLHPACVRRGNWINVLVSAACVFLAAWFASATSNLNSAQVGTVRYATWLLAPLWYTLFRHIPARFSLSLGGVAMGTALALSTAMVFVFKYDRLLRKDIVPFGGAWRAQPEVAAMVRMLPYESDAEIVVENILGYELVHPTRFRDVYIWDLGADHYLWLFSERALMRQHPVVLQTTEPNAFRVRAKPTQRVNCNMDGNIATLQVTDPPPEMRIHPVLGKYLLLRSRGRITQILKNQLFHIRSDGIEQVDAFDQEHRFHPNSAKE